MKERVLFKKGKQKEFLDLVKERLDSPSIRSLLQYGINSTYTSLKNYYIERRLLSRSLFEDLCYLAKIDLWELDVEYVMGNFGQVKGGRIGKRKKFK